MVNINIGIDIGGNHVGMGVVNENGEILKSDAYIYENKYASAEYIFSYINHFIDVSKEYNPQYIGIGIPGIVSGKRINYTCNLPIGNFDMMDYIESDLPIFLSNDANCAAIAEYELKIDKKYSNYALITIGTGIGAGIIIDGKLYLGSSGASGEIGHIVIEKDGLPCKCGRKGCFEQYASCTALKRMTGLDSLKEIFYLAETNETVKKVFNEYLDNLSEGIANFVNIFDIEMISIGGGISRYIEKYIPIIQDKITSKICNKFTYNININIATLQNDAGIIGASFLNKYIK